MSGTSEKKQHQVTKTEENRKTSSPRNTTRYPRHTPTELKAPLLKTRPDSMNSGRGRSGGANAGTNSGNRRSGGTNAGTDSGNRRSGSANAGTNSGNRRSGSANAGMNSGNRRSGSANAGTNSGNRRSGSANAGMTPGRDTGKRVPPLSDEEREQRRRRSIEIRRKRRRRQALIRRAKLVLIFGAAAVAVILLAAGIHKYTTAQAQKKAEAEAAAEAARTMQSYDASDVLHLSFHVLELDADNDVDHDGIPDTEDDLIDADGDGVADEGTDVDNDGIPDVHDDLIDSNGDGVADDTAAGTAQDSDGDGIPDDEDDFVDADGDGAADLTVDTDGDGVADAAAGTVTEEKSLTVSEFNAILEDLYAQDYVLVNPYSLISKDDSGMTEGTVSVPKGKKPLIISEQNVSYTAGYDGSADKLTLASDGSVTNTWTNKDGTTGQGAADVITCVDAFITAHPDFSCNGARGIIGITGSNGIFGYAIDQDDKIIGALSDSTISEVTAADKENEGSGDSSESGEASGDADSAGSGSGNADGDKNSTDAAGGEASGEDSTASGGTDSTASGGADSTASGGTDSTASEDTDSTDNTAVYTYEETESVSASSASVTSASAGSGTAAQSGVILEAQKRHDSEIADNRATLSSLISTLRSEGWQFACNSYRSISYASSYEIVKADIDSWMSRCSDLVGTTDMILLPGGGDIGSWSGYSDSNEKFTYLKNQGFTFYFTDTSQSKTWLQIRPDYAREAMHDIKDRSDYDAVMAM